MKKLTVCQQKALSIIKDVIKRTKKRDFVLAVITGQAGCGKSSVFMTAASLLVQEEVPFQILSPIAANCEALNARTIHSYLGLFNNKKQWKDLINEPIRPKVKHRISQTQLILVDEIFLTGSKAFSGLLRRIANVKKRTLDRFRLTTFQ